MFAFYRYWSKIDQYFFRHCDMTWYVIFYNVWCYNYDNEHFLQMISILLKYFNGTNYPSVSLCFALFWRGGRVPFRSRKTLFFIKLTRHPSGFFPIHGHKLFKITVFIGKLYTTFKWYTIFGLCNSYLYWMAFNKIDILT